MKTYIRYAVITLFISIFHSSNVYAHHPLAGQKMETFFHGLLSGFGHPILGFDHLFFIIGVGILCLLARKIFLGPLAFIIGMISGLFLIISGYDLFLVEFVIATSILLIGIFIISGKKVNFNFISLSLFIIGLFLLNEYEYINLPFLWLNFVGCFFAMIIALLFSLKNSNSKTNIILVTFISVLMAFGYLIYENSI